MGLRTGRALPEACCNGFHYIGPGSVTWDTSLIFRYRLTTNPVEIVSADFVEDLRIIECAFSWRPAAGDPRLPPLA